MTYNVKTMMTKMMLPKKLMIPKKLMKEKRMGIHIVMYLLRMLKAPNRSADSELQVSCNVDLRAYTSL